MNYPKLLFICSAVIMAQLSFAQQEKISHDRMSDDEKAARELEDKLRNERLKALNGDQSEPVPVRLKELHEITAKTEYNKKQEKVAELRLDALKVSAFSWGTQEGMFWRYQKIQRSLESNSLQLHTIADFNKFLVDGKMLMPVISKSERMFLQETSSKVRTVSVAYNLEKPAKLVAQPPTWRDYLVRVVDEPVKPHDALFPRTELEQVVWRDALDRGWAAGVEQANDIFDIDLRRLHSDLDGMYRFRTLLVQNIVSLPEYKDSRYAVMKVEDGKTIHLNDVVYEITEQSEFSDTKKWEPFFNEPGEKQ